VVLQQGDIYLVGSILLKSGLLLFSPDVQSAKISGKKLANKNNILNKLNIYNICLALEKFLRDNF
jgi:hypothetical protein